MSEIDVQNAKELALSLSSRVFKNLIFSGGKIEELGWGPKDQSKSYQVFHEFLTRDHPSDYQERVQALEGVVQDMTFAAERNSYMWTAAYERHMPPTISKKVSDYCQACVVWAAQILNTLSPEHPPMVFDKDPPKPPSSRSFR